MAGLPEEAQQLGQPFNAYLMLSLLHDLLEWMMQQGREASDTHLKFAYTPAAKQQQQQQQQRGPSRGPEQYGVVHCHVVPEGQLAFRVQEALERAVLAQQAAA